MKTLFLIVFLSLANLFACTGDCFSCHQSLLKNIENDERHKSMKTCIKCHSPNPQSMAECGPDCFSCHPKEKLEEGFVKEHKPIAGCRDCHMKKSSIFSLSAGDKFESNFLKNELFKK